MIIQDSGCVTARGGGSGGGGGGLGLHHKLSRYGSKILPLLSLYCRIEDIITSREWTSKYGLHDFEVSEALIT